MRASVVTILCSFVLASSSLAAPRPLEKGAVELSGIVGASFPMGNLADVATTGLGIGASFGYFFSPRASLGAQIVFNDFGVDDSIEDDPDISTDFSITEIGVVWKALFGEGGSVQPYGRGIIGIFRAKVSASADVFGVNVEASATESEVGIGAGFGAQLRGEGSLGGFVEGQLFTVFTEGETTNYVGLRAGVSFFLIKDE